jgi:DNA-binding response OmpR family regulator
MMPKMSGLEVTEKLRAHAATARLPIILLTARVSEEDVHRGFEAGADDYVKKPFSPQDLQTRVEAFLGRRGA